jgi:STE24 endopeptidase
MADPAKSYSCRKYALNITDMFYNVALILAVLGSGFSVFLERSIGRLGLTGYPSMAVFLAAVLFLYCLLNLPLSFYSGYTLEHKFNLSRQGRGDWWMDQFKSLLLTYLLVLALLSGFYWILSRFGQWWIALSVFWIIFVLVLARLTPVFIVPLFFKYRKLDDETLRGRVFALARQMRVQLLDVFEIDFSRKTLKGNAAFVGMGRSKRVILADTLKERYNYEEIESILAHEFAHFRLRHIAKSIAANSLLVTGLFYLIFRTNAYFLSVFGLDSLSQPASIPLIFLYFSVFSIVLRPLSAYISRRFERQADRLAIETTRNRDAFISVMEKLAVQNLADRDPHPLIKFFFFDHPPEKERINTARSYRLG